MKDLDEDEGESDQVDLDLATDEERSEYDVKSLVTGDVYLLGGHHCLQSGTDSTQSSSTGSALGSMISTVNRRKMRKRTKSVKQRILKAQDRAILEEEEKQEDDEARD